MLIRAFITTWMGKPSWEECPVIASLIFCCALFSRRLRLWVSWFSFSASSPALQCIFLQEPLISFLKKNACSTLHSFYFSSAHLPPFLIFRPFPKVFPFPPSSLSCIFLSLTMKVFVQNTGH